MLRLIQLITVAAAGTVSNDASATEKKLKTQYKKDGKIIITGSSKILRSDFEMPRFITWNADSFKFTNSKSTYEDVIKNDHFNPEYCYQCVFSGGDWKLDSSIANKNKELHQCVYTTKKLDELKKANPKDTDVSIYVDNEITYKQLFNGLESCIGTKDKVDLHQVIVQNGYERTKDSKMTPTCKSSWDLAQFKVGAPKNNRHNDEKNDSDRAANIEYTWATEDKTTEGAWCYIRTYLPAKFSGGLILTHQNDADTTLALKVHATLTRYFDNKTLKKDAIGKTGKIGLYSTSIIEIFMAQADKYKEAVDGTKDKFKVTFTRATFWDIGLITIQHGGWIVWAIIGSLLCCIILFMFCLWRKCTSGKKDADDRFYQEDMYARV